MLVTVSTMLSHILHRMEKTTKMKEMVHESGRRIKNKDMFVTELQAKLEANYVKQKHWQSTQYLKITSIITWHSDSILFNLYLSWNLNLYSGHTLGGYEQCNKRTHSLHRLTNLTTEAA